MDWSPFGQCPADPLLSALLDDLNFNFNEPRLDLPFPLNDYSHVFDELFEELPFSRTECTMDLNNLIPTPPASPRPSSNIVSPASSKVAPPDTGLFQQNTYSFPHPISSTAISANDQMPIPPGLPSDCPVEQPTSLIMESTINRAIGARPSTDELISGSSTTPSTISHIQYSCQMCAKSFQKKYLLNVHTRLHTKPIECVLPGCSHRTAKKRDMDRHFAAHHCDKSPTPRPVCPVSGCKFAKLGFARKDHLTRHLKRAHRAESENQ